MSKPDFAERLREFLDGHNAVATAGFLCQNTEAILALIAETKREHHGHTIKCKVCDTIRKLDEAE